ncbi:MAG: hypothetical protein IJF38_00455 [Clostridia bacterium]|nr:hypothetical protein [Clostridia bacterium]
MFTVNAVSAVCLVLMMIWLLSVLVNLLSRAKPRAEKIAYIRNFKRGKGVLIYLFTLPLFTVGISYVGVPFPEVLFRSIKQVVELVILKYDTSSVSVLLSESAFYSFVLYTSFFLVGANALMFVFSLASQHLSSFFNNLYFFTLSLRERVIIIGNNEGSRAIYRSESARARIIADKMSDGDAYSLYSEGIAYRQVSDFGDLIDRIIKKALRSSSRTYVILNSDDKTTLELCRLFISKMKAMPTHMRERFFGALHIYAFGDPRYRAIYEDVAGDALGSVSYVNKYQRVAMDFICDHPFTRFMTSEHIDYKTSYVREGVEINALMIGFGRTNQEIFLTSVANNQFIEAGPSGAVLKPVRYYIFDKDHAENNKNLNHTYNRYRNEMREASPDLYLPLPDHPASESFLKLDVNDTAFYKEIRRIITKSERHVNFIIIAYGTDLENIDMAQKLLEKRREWGVGRLTVFVKVREDIGAAAGLLDEPDCIIIGNESECVYDVERIISPETYRMARLRDGIYALEYEITEGRADTLTEKRVADIKARSGRDWFVKKTECERDSSLYCVLSLKSKLHMMGLDYLPRRDGEGLTREEYLEIYAGADRPDDTKYPIKADGKDIIHYTKDFAEGRRRDMAIHEHLRWNSYMISRGMIPATIEEILNETVECGGDIRHTNGKSYTLRRHGNLTTFEGLVSFRRMVAEREGCDEGEKDVIKYDYQILDDAHWLLDKMGYMIVRRKDAI